MSRCFIVFFVGCFRGRVIVFLLFSKMSPYGKNIASGEGCDDLVLGTILV